MSLFQNYKQDLPASLVVFLVALPLCLGIALASGADPFSGIVSGIVGGIVVGYFSGSNVSVSGPAAGLAVIVERGIADLSHLPNSFEVFLLAVVFSGVLQLILGFAKAGKVANFIPSSVIKGMLAAIGLLLILKQIPHALGIDTDYEGDEAFTQDDGENTISEMGHAFLDFEPGAILVAVVAAILIIIWSHKKLKHKTFFQLFPGALAAVIIGAVLNNLLGVWLPEWQLKGSHLVQLPLDAIQGHPERLIRLPDFTAWNNIKVYELAVIIAIIASLESLLSLEASDKLDPARRLSPPNQELKAQGLGNIIAGLLGGLPVTAVIVRSSANVVAGAKTRLSAIAHGMLLLISALLFPNLLNYIPKAALASVLILVGYKLISVDLIRENLKKGMNQFIPFAVTIVAIVFTDLLKGIGIGLLVGLVFVIRSNFRQGITYVCEGSNHLIRLRDNVSYLNKGRLSAIIEALPNEAEILIDGASARFIDPDIYELLDDLIRSAKEKGWKLEIIRRHNSQNVYFQLDGEKFNSET
ncbi:MAG: SulP family inorganic anion transporter [Bacteroidetes bacterium]|nr:MAG: SulP family inorganic anion transporter [Bacteroidota bacterium]